MTDDVQVVVAHRARAALRVGDTFLKIDPDEQGIDNECVLLVAEGILPHDLVAANRRIAERALRAWTPVFAHGDLQITHVFVDPSDGVSGIIDWSAAGVGDAFHDLATLTLNHEENLADLLDGYGPGVDPEVIRSWWSLRALTATRWLLQHGFDAFAPGAEVDVLKAALTER
jgi:aminoglycoside phosphotransferase (APT) family kinase protein